MWPTRIRAAFTLAAIVLTVVCWIGAAFGYYWGKTGIAYVLTITPPIVGLILHFLGVQFAWIVHDLSLLRQERRSTGTGPHRLTPDGAADLADVPFGQCLGRSPCQLTAPGQRERTGWPKSQ